MTRLLLAAALLLAPACQCFVPVEELCGPGFECPLADSGTDGGTDGGTDAGRDGGADAGTGCERWDGGGVGICAALTGYLLVGGTTCEGACVHYPITAPGVFPDLQSCASRCAEAGFCDETKLINRPPSGPLGPESYCDDLVVQTLLPRLIVDAFPGFDAGCRPTSGGLSECLLWRGYLGDAGYARACAATLVPRVQTVRCSIYL